MINTVFLDRDGVINVNIPKGYVTRPEDLALLPGVAASVKLLNDAAIPVVVISNQQGVGKGLMTVDMLKLVDDEMHSKLNELEGAKIVKSYYCIHLKSDECTCRKPKGGQLRTAAKDLSVDLSTSVFVGDSPTDIEAGRDAGVGHCALVLSGATKSYVPGQWPVDPDSIHRNLEAVVGWIFAQNGQAS